MPAWLREVGIHAGCGLVWMGLVRLIDPLAGVVLPVLACVLLAILHVLREGWGGLRWGAILSSWAVGCGLLLVGSFVLAHNNPEMVAFCFLVAPPLSLATSMVVVLVGHSAEDEPPESDLT